MKDDNMVRGGQHLAKSFKEKGIECIDLNRIVAKELEFWDIAHLSPSGEEFMGQYLANLIAQTTI